MERKKFNKDVWWALLFLGPSIIGLGIFTVYPIFESLHLSFCNWGLFDKKVFVGLANYIKFFQDPIALKVFANTIFFTLVAVPVQLVIAFFLSVALNQKIFGMRFFRAAYFLPTLASMVSISIIWEWLFNTQFGLVNYFLSFLGVPSINWLTTTTHSLWTIIIVSVWKGTGYNMMIFLAGLQAIPSVYYDAAEIDGCNGLRRLVKITWPLLKPTTLFASVTTIINSMQVFDQVMIITGGGPARSSSVMVQYLYENAFDYYKMGYACALGWILAIFIFILSVINFTWNKEDYSIE